MEEESEEDASVDLPNLKPLQLDKDLKERVLQQLVPVRLQHLDITSGLPTISQVPRPTSTVGWGT